MYVPAAPQQEVNIEAEAWSEQWGVNLDIPPAVFPQLEIAPPAPTLPELVTAIMSFHIGIALGTDMYHPRTLPRLAPALLSALLNVFVLFEVLGTWPSVITDGLIALIPKVSGGRRPIGICLTLIGIWLRLRAPHVRAWERAHERAFFYAGQGRGAYAAVWLKGRVDGGSMHGSTFISCRSPGFG